MNDPKWVLQQISYRQLEVFRQVVESGNFSSAARELGLNQSTVSRHVNQLEELFDTPLLVKRSSRYQLTELGILINEKAAAMLAVRQDFEQGVLAYFDRIEEELVVGASTIPGEVILPRMVSRFRRSRTDLKTDLVIADSSEILGRIKDGELRYGIVGIKPEDSSLSFQPLFQDEMVLVGLPEFSTTEPGETVQLEELPYVGRREGSGTRRAVLDSVRSSPETDRSRLNVVARVSTIQAVREAVREGMGVSFLPIRMVRREIETGVLEVLPTSVDPIKRIFYGVENSFLGLTTLLEDFRQFLRDHGDREADRDAG